MITGLLIFSAFCLFWSHTDFSQCVSASRVFFIWERVYFKTKERWYWTPFMRARKRYKTWCGYFEEPTDITTPWLPPSAGSPGE